MGNNFNDGKGRSEGRRDYARSNNSSRNFNRNSGSSYGNRRNFGERRGFSSENSEGKSESGSRTNNGGRSYGERRSYNGGGRSFGNGGGERRSYNGGGRSFGNGGGERKSYNGGGRSFGNGGGERRSYNGGGRSFGNGGGERRSYNGGERRSYNGGGRSFGNGDGERRSYNGGGRSFGNGGGERRSFNGGGNRASFGNGGGRSFGNGGGERRSYNGGGRSFGNGGGERRSYNGGGRSFGNGGGERRSYNGGERRSYNGGGRSFGNGGERRSYNGGGRSFGNGGGRNFGNGGRPFEKDNNGINKMIDRKAESIKNIAEQAKGVEFPTKDVIRLNKYIANSGVCSRREADSFIQAGVVTVNGEVVAELGTKVNVLTDDVRFNGTRLKGEEKVYIIMNKPKGYVTTLSDPHANKTVMDLLRGCSTRVFPVGRLDKNTTGVLMFTNDGELAEKLTHPSYNKKKIYQVVLDKALHEDEQTQILEGIELNDGLVKADELEYIDEGDHRKLGIEIHSGKNRIVRRIFESFGYSVRMLDRVYFAGLTKKGLKRGEWRSLTEGEVNVLKMGAYI